MAVLGALRERSSLLLRSERGIALPTALFAMVASMALAGAAVMSSVDVQRGFSRDSGSKNAIAAADAGANVAMMRLNRHGGLLSEVQPCLVVNSSDEIEAGSAPAGASGWCAPIEGEVGGASYSYRVSAWGSDCGPRDVCVVSTGTANEVSRRVELSLDESALWVGLTEEEIIKKEIELEEKRGGSETNLKELEEKLKKTQEEESKGGGIAGLVGRDSIVSTGNANIQVGVATNGNLTTSGNTSICGSIQIGIGKKWEKNGNAKQCSGYPVTEGTMSLPAVSSFIPSDIATNNSNARITTCSKGLPSGCQLDTYTGKWTSSPPFDASKRRITLSSNDTLTVGGGDYWICSLTFSGNSKLVMAKGAHVRFFFDTPEHCGTSNQISMSGNNEITATGYQPSLGQFDVPGFYLLGSTTYASEISLSGNSSTTSEFVIYGPESSIAVSGNATFKGIIAGKTIAWSGNGKLEQDAGFTIPPGIEGASGDGSGAKKIEEEKLTVEEEIKKLEEELQLLKEGGAGEAGGRSFSAQSYVECTGGATETGEEPNSGC